MLIFTSQEGILEIQREREREREQSGHQFCETNTQTNMIWNLLSNQSVSNKLQV